MPGPITTALERWRQGDPDAQYDLHRELLPFLVQLTELVRRKRAGPLRARIDTQGVINDGLKSLFSGIPKGEFPALYNHEDVQKLLRTIVMRALTDKVRFHLRKGRTPYREQRDGAEALKAAQSLSVPFEIWLEDFLAAVRPVHEKAIDIVSLRLQGQTNLEIAHELGLGPRTVQLIVHEMNEAWKQKHKQAE
jgi:hypothetical protein